MTTLPPLALSVRQPWAWAIMHARKDVENRDWRQPNPGLKFRGPVAIHAASGMTRDEYKDAAFFIRRLAGDVPGPHELVRGAIVGHVQIMDIIRDPCREMITSPWYFGRVGLLLAHAEPCEPIPCKGALGFFRWSRADTSAIQPPARWMLPKPPIAAKTEPQGELI